MGRVGKLRMLAPFDDEVCKLLKELDNACAVQTAMFKEEMNKASLKGEVFSPDMETLVWLKFIKGFGILYNRAIDAGWVRDILLDNKR